MEYNKSGVFTKMNYANNTFQTWDFDKRKRISQIEVYNSGNQLLEKLNYKLNGVGDVTSINDTYNYEYYGFGRITGALTLLPGKQDPMKLVNDHFGSFKNATVPNLLGTTYNVEADIFPVFNPDGVINGEDHIQASLTDFDSLYDNESFTYVKKGNRLTLNQNGDLYRYVYGKRNRLLEVYLTKKGEETEKIYINYEYDVNSNTTKRTIKATDNSRMESFFATLKKEKIYKMNTMKMKREEVKTVVWRYVMVYYNRQRITTVNKGGYAPTVFRNMVKNKLIAA